MKLAIFDLSGIQRFIFATNTLKEIVGASFVVHDALFRMLPEVMGVDPEVMGVDPGGWGQKRVDPDAEESQIIYIGGGNALALFPDDESYRSVARKLFFRVFTASGGAIRLMTTCVELDKAASLSENQKRLMGALDAAKKSGGNVGTVPALPITAVDNNNYEPMVLVGERVYAPLSAYAKQKAYADAAASGHDPFEWYRPNGKAFRTDFEGSRVEDEKNYQAIIHIDDNTMGIRIREYVGNLRGSLADQMMQMRQLSADITKLYRETLADTLNELYGNDEDPAINFRLIIADGDDITVMLEDCMAFRFVETFLGRLRGKDLTAFGSDFIPTAAAGVAFVKLKFPFYVAYELAEACCKNAKAVTISRCGGAQEFNRHPVSSMDYQICYSNISEDMDDFRRINYVRMKDGKEYSLTKRPYMFTDDTRPYSYNAFMEEANKLLADKREGKIARSKLKGLRNAYGISVDEAEQYGEFILSHVKKEDELETAKLLSRPFNESCESCEARFFDFLDVMDIAWEEEKE